MKKSTPAIIIVSLIIVLPIAWYLISPLWHKQVVNDVSPLSVTPPTTTTGTTTPISGTVPAQAQAQIVAQGSLIPKAHDVAGQALLIQDAVGKQILRFENFQSTDGPDVHVYLSADYDARDAVELGRLKATSGNVNYDVPAGVDSKKYNKVLIWCRPFHVLFSATELK